MLCDQTLKNETWRVEKSFFTVGMEAVGEVVVVGPGLTGRKVGDIVGYAGNPMGSYTEEQILPADKVVPVPSSISPNIAASVMLKGMTAQFLLRRCFKVSFIFIREGFVFDIITVFRLTIVLN